MKSWVILAGMVVCGALSAAVNAAAAPTQPALKAVSEAKMTRSEMDAANVKPELVKPKAKGEDAIYPHFQDDCGPECRGKLTPIR